MGSDSKARFSLKPGFHCNGHGLNAAMTQRFFISGRIADMAEKLKIVELMAAFSPCPLQWKPGLTN